MPELPEVETIVRMLRTQLVGQRVVSWPRCVATSVAAEFERELAGREILDVRRRGKFVVIPLSGDKFCLVHLRMTGRLIIQDSTLTEACISDPHVHALFHFASGRILCFRDTRKFGRLYLVDDPAEVVGDLGPEPLAEDFTSQHLYELLRSHRKRLKPLLADQRLLAGLGNIYIDEALWEAKIHPLRLGHTLSMEETERLHAAIRGVLSRAIENLGTTLRDYRTPLGVAGGNQETLVVYGRQGQPCPRCGTPIRREVIGGRGTWYCPSCQAGD